MKKITFDTIDSKEDKLFINTVNGYEIKIDNYTFGLYKNIEKMNWYIVDFKTGRYFEKAKTQKEVINKVINLMDFYKQKVLTDNYNKMVNDFKQLKIDNDPYYYCIKITNKYNCIESFIFDTYQEALNYKTCNMTFNNNIFIDKVLKNN